MQLFYFPEVSLNTHQHKFPKDEARHLIKVLRKRTGDRINFTNGMGALFQGELVIQGNSCTLENIQVVPTDNEQFVCRELPYKLHIAIAPTKSNDRMEWFLEKAVELGVTRVTPLLCEHSERNRIRLERFEKIMVSAMKQSQRLHLPQLDPLTPINNFIANDILGQKFMAHLEDGTEQDLSVAMDINFPSTILIGPEGDFSRSEIKEASAAGFRSVRLGGSRLRTETAGIYAVSIAKKLWDSTEHP